MNISKNTPHRTNGEGYLFQYCPIKKYLKYYLKINAYLFGY